MNHVQVQIRCQRCGVQMELTDPGPNDPWPPQQFWECPACGRHFWTTYPPPKPAKPAGTSKTTATPKPKVTAPPAKTAKPDAGTPPDVQASQSKRSSLAKPDAAISQD